MKCGASPLAMPSLSVTAPVAPSRSLASRACELTDSAVRVQQTVAGAGGRNTNASSSAICSLTRRAEDGAVSTEVKRVPRSTPRTSLRMGLPSKGRMSEDTMTLMKESALSVKKINPRQYVARIPEIPSLEVWFQRASDVVRKLRTGDLDLGIVGTDMFQELIDDDPDVIVVHEALDFGQCKLALGIPMGGRFASVESLEALRNMADWSEETPLRVVTGYHNIAKRFFAEKGFKHVVLLSADGALEAAPAMGSADIILDLVSTGVTLRENNLKEIAGGDIMQSQGILVANKTSLMDRPGLLAIVHELIERFDAHLKAEQFYSVIANMRGSSAEEVATLLLNSGVGGLQGPTLSSVYNMEGNNSSGAAEHGFYAATICVPKKKLYSTVKILQKLGGSGVLVQPMTYIFDEEPKRWMDLLGKLNLTDKDVFNHSS